jgi:hypothetical protein
MVSRRLPCLRGGGNRARGQDWFALAYESTQQARTRLAAFQPARAEGQALQRRYLEALRTAERVFHEATPPRGATGATP